MSIKLQYAKNHNKFNDNSLRLNKRLFLTYDRISEKCKNGSLKGVNVDLGCGDKGFSRYCETICITSFPYDYPEFNLECDHLEHADNSIDFITLNAVIEHISKPENIFKEIYRCLKKGSLVFIRTPNWQMDYKNFYNDPTHIRPYAPDTMKNFLHLMGLDCIFLEPGLIEKSWFWWKLPNLIKWRIAAFIPGGTKSILTVAMKPF